MAEPTEIVVFLSYENEAPRTLAEALVDELGLQPIAAGVDALTGGVELRFYYHATRVDLLRDWLVRRGALFSVEVRRA